MNSDHHVIGNGESRKDLNVDNLHGTKYGCNAIYRDWYTDYLFNKDKPIQHEILDSYCWLDRKVIYKLDGLVKVITARHITQCHYGKMC